MEILCKGGRNPWYYTSVEEWENSFKRTLETPFKRFLTLSFITATPFHTKRPLQGWVTPATKTTAPYKAGLFIWKGYEMKKYIPLDFDEKGKVILGREKNAPTPNGTIPAIFIPGGSDENKQGLKSITISPAITTTPALDSLFPIYYEDLTEKEKTDGRNIDVVTESIPAGEYTFTITPTAGWYAGYLEDGETSVISDTKGAPFTHTITRSEASESIGGEFFAINTPTLTEESESVLIAFMIGTGE